MYKICIYVPEEALAEVKAAMFAAGAGKIGNYDQCAWECLGRGQYRPLENSQPAIGTHYKIQTVNEYCLEMVCEEDVLSNVIDAIHQSHPYEEPAYQYWQINQG